MDCIAHLCCTGEIRVPPLRQTRLGHAQLTLLIPHNNIITQPAQSITQSYQIYNLCNYYIGMGCTGLSAYNDEVIGATAYPPQILTDIHARNLSTPAPMAPQTQGHGYEVVGFGQSYAQARLFTYVKDKKQYLVYPAGRFLVVLDIESRKQRSLQHEDRIVAVDGSGRLCLVGVLGGGVVLWDLDFMQQKVSIRLPATCLSSLSFSQKYIFATDTRTPHCHLHCYDTRTAKPRTRTRIPTYEPTLKAICWKSNTHITVCADGVWFSRYSDNLNQFQVTKGMFGMFPKTAMTCVKAVDEEYVLTGSVDGYVFLWARYQCQKVLKVADCGVSEMGVWGRRLVTGNFGGGVRVFEFTIRRKSNYQELENNHGDITDQFVSILLDSYTQDPLQSLTSSVSDPSVYFAQTRSGTLFAKCLPSQAYQPRQPKHPALHEPLIQYQQDSHKYLHGQNLWFIKLVKQQFMVKKTEIKGEVGQWRVVGRYRCGAQKYRQSDKTVLYCFVPEIESVCYTDLQCVYLAAIKDTQVKIQTEDTLSQEQIILKPQPSNNRPLQITGLALFRHKNQPYLLIYLDSQYIILGRIDNNWQVVQQKQCSLPPPQQIVFQDQAIVIELQGNMYRQVSGLFDEEQREYIGGVHCGGRVEEGGRLGDGRVVTLGDLGLVK